MIKCQCGREYDIEDLVIQGEEIDPDTAKTVLITFLSGGKEPSNELVRISESIVIMLHVQCDECYRQFYVAAFNDAEDENNLIYVVLHMGVEEADH